MNKALRIVIGAATLWPIGYAMFFIGAGFFSFFYPAYAHTWDSVFLPLLLLTIVLIWSLLAFYLIHLYKSDRVNRHQKLPWILALFAGTIIAMPVFWYLYIWRDASETIVRVQDRSITKPDR